MSVLLDTDILVDVALDRGPHAQDASALLDLLQQRPGEGWLSWHSVSNFYYLVSPRRGSAETRRFINELAVFIDIAPVTTESLRYACHLAMRDFEDAMQVAAAVACGASVIATRNLRDFARSPVRAAKASAVIEELGLR